MGVQYGNIEFGNYSNLQLIIEGWNYKFIRFLGNAYPEKISSCCKARGKTKKLITILLWFITNKPIELVNCSTTLVLPEGILSSNNFTSKILGRREIHKMNVGGTETYEVAKVEIVYDTIYIISLLNWFTLYNQNSQTCSDYCRKDLIILLNKMLGALIQCMHVPRCLVCGIF